MGVAIRHLTVCASPDGSAAFRLWLLPAASGGSPSGGRAAAAAAALSPLPSRSALETPFSVEQVFHALGRARLDGELALLERPSLACAGRLTDLLYEFDPHGVLVWLPDGLGWDPVVEPGAQLDRLWHAGLRWSLLAWPELAAASIDDILAGAWGAGEPGAPMLRLSARRGRRRLPERPVVAVGAGEELRLHLRADAVPGAQVALVELISGSRHFLRQNPLLRCLGTLTA